MNELSGINTKKNLDDFIKYNENILEDQLKEKTKDSLITFQTKPFKLEKDGNVIKAQYKFDSAFTRPYGMQGKDDDGVSTPFLAEKVFILRDDEDIGGWEWSNFCCKEMYSLRNGKIFAIHDANDIEKPIEMVGKDLNGKHYLTKYEDNGSSCTTYLHLGWIERNKPQKIPSNIEGLIDKKLKEGKKVVDPIKEYVATSGILDEANIETRYF